jgi:phage baseplate assembly protein W
MSEIQKYVDFDLNFEVSPLYEKGDILLKTDVDAVEQSITNILLTNKYERPFNHSLSGGSRGAMFEPDASDLFAGHLSYINAAENVINKFEPRARKTKLKVKKDTLNNTVIEVAFNALNTNQEVSIVLQRDR